MSEENVFDYGPVKLKDGPPDLKGRLYAFLSRNWVYADEGQQYGKIAPLAASMALDSEHGAQVAPFRSKALAQAV